jgi:hypothetical protein
VVLKAQARAALRVAAALKASAEVVAEEAKAEAALEVAGQRAAPLIKAEALRVEAAAAARRAATT